MASNPTKTKGADAQQEALIKRLANEYDPVQRDVRKNLAAFARLHNVPYQKLRARVRARDAPPTRRGTLSEAQELALIQLIHTELLSGDETAVFNIHAAANHILHTSGENRTVGRGWSTYFLKRHPELQVQRKTPKGTLSQLLVASPSSSRGHDQPSIITPAGTEASDQPQPPTPLESICHGDNKLPGIPTFPTFFSHRQWQLEHMAAAFRYFSRHGYVEGMSGHISVRDPEHRNAFWINPLAVHFGLLKASDMILLDLDGNVIGGNRNRPANAAGFLIHAAVHRARPDAHAACHAHTVHGRAWSAFARPLDMLTQDVCNFYNAHSVYASYGGLVLAKEEGERIAEALGEGKGCILMNHGLLTVGGTVDEAAFLFGLMERSCQIQLLAEVAANKGLQKKIISDKEAECNFKASDPVS